MQYTDHESYKCTLETYMSPRCHPNNFNFKKERESQLCKHQGKGRAATVQDACALKSTLRETRVAAEECERQMANKEVE